MAMVIVIVKVRDWVLGWNFEVVKQWRRVGDFALCVCQREVKAFWMRWKARDEEERTCLSLDNIIIITMIIIIIS